MAEGPHQLCRVVRCCSQIRPASEITTLSSTSNATATIRGILSRRSRKAKEGMIFNVSKLSIITRSPRCREGYAATFEVDTNHSSFVTSLTWLQDGGLRWGALVAKVASSTCAQPSEIIKFLWGEVLTGLTVHRRELGGGVATSLSDPACPDVRGERSFSNKPKPRSISRLFREDRELRRYFGPALARHT